MAHRSIYLLFIIFLSCAGAGAGAGGRKAGSHAMLSPKKYLLQKVKKHRIVCVGDWHGLVNPLKLISANIPVLYENGLRCIVVEEWFSRKRIQDERAAFFAYYPWGNFFQTIEYLRLYQAIYRFNASLDIGKGIRLVHGEPAVSKIKTVPQSQWQNFRDKYIARVVVGEERRLAPRERMLVYYGAWHARFDAGNQYDSFGVCRPHIPMGVHLRKKFGSSFFSINPVYSNGRDGHISRRYPSIVRKRFQQWTGSFGVDVRGSWFDNQYEGRDYRAKFDGVLFYKNTDIGVPMYATRDFRAFKNLILLLKETVKFHAENWSSGTRGFLSKQLAPTMYYMQQNFSESLPYHFWSPSVSLKQLIAKSEEALSRMERRLIRSSRIEYQKLSDFYTWLGQAKDAIFYKQYQQALLYLRKAERFYPEDCYLQYFLFKTHYRLGNVRKALQYARKVVQNNNFFNMRKLPEVLKELVRFYRVMGMQTEAGRLKKHLRTLRREDLDRYRMPCPGHFVIAGAADAHGKKLFRFGDYIIRYNGMPVTKGGMLEKLHRNNRTGAARIDLLRNRKKLHFTVRKRRLGILLYNGKTL